MNSAETLVVYIYGTPRSDRGATAAQMCAELARAGLSALLAPSYAAELEAQASSSDVAEARRARRLLDGTYRSQLAVVAEQMRRIDSLCGLCDVVVTEAPPLQEVAWSSPSMRAENREELTRRASEHLRSRPAFSIVAERGEGESAVIEGILREQGVFYGRWPASRILRSVDSVAQEVLSSRRSHVPEQPPGTTRLAIGRDRCHLRRARTSFWSIYLPDGTVLPDGRDVSNYNFNALREWVDQSQNDPKVLYVDVPTCVYRGTKRESVRKLRLRLFANGYDEPTDDIEACVLDVAEALPPIPGRTASHGEEA